MTWAHFLFGSVPCSHWSVHTGLLEKLLTAWGNTATIPSWSEGLCGCFSFSFYANDKQFCERVGRVTQQLSCRSRVALKKKKSSTLFNKYASFRYTSQSSGKQFFPCFVLQPLGLPVYFAILWPVFFYPNASATQTKSDRCCIFFKWLTMSSITMKNVFFFTIDNGINHINSCIFLKVKTWNESSCG